MGSAILGCPFGPLAGLWLADRFGRRKTLILSSVAFLVSAVGCALAGDMMQFIVWRFVGGMGIGLAATVSPMYIAEVAPARLRGRLVLVNQLAIVVGGTLSAVVAYLLSDGGHWRWMFASQAVPVFWLMVGLVFVPESPRWLAMMGRNGDALRVLAKINGQSQAERDLNEIRTELGDESGDFAELFQPGVRMALIIGIVLMVFSQISGATIIHMYAPTLFVESGISDAVGRHHEQHLHLLLGHALHGDLLLGRPHVRPPSDHHLRFDRHGRRTSVAVPVLHAPLADRAYACSDDVHLGGLHVDAGAFELGRPFGDLPEPRSRQGHVAGHRDHVRSRRTPPCKHFPSMMDWFKEQYGHPGGTFLIFLCICLLCALFVWRMLPETKDKTLEEIGEFWLNRRHTTRPNGMRSRNDGGDEGCDQAGPGRVPPFND